ncbi:MAG: asparagine synthase (glutamine-hydrolyzing) [Calditrichia bacterium]
MCGIAGYFGKHIENSEGYSILKKMISRLGHRGPDEIGMYKNSHVGFVQSRLSIIDLDGGSQPIHNEDKSLWIIFNGEIFNYVELREILVEKGHVFYTRTDTEVLIHLYEEYEENMLSMLNGQFAFAIFDKNKEELFLARDHIGIVPLFYTTMDKNFIFASEIKSLFAYPGMDIAFDFGNLLEIYTFWSNIPGNTPFRNIHELEPGHFLVISNGTIKKQQYWEISFEKNYQPVSVVEDELRELLDDASAIRLRADVPVASYLSGGIDSSIIAYLIKKFHNNDLMTFSIGFEDPHFDESKYQQLMVDFLKTEHKSTAISYEAIAEVFNQIIYHTERPTFRTAPAPLFHLSGLVRENGIKVVLTGEGADEVFGGYNIYKEAKIRKFLSANPDSAMREALLDSLYPYIKKDPRIGKFWIAFFKKNLEQSDSLLFSHSLRWGNGLNMLNYILPDKVRQFNPEEKQAQIESLFPSEASGWSVLNRAQFLEMKLFLPGYLLSTQGDRMLMGHSVEGRFPYLDKRVIEFANQLPDYIKLSGLNEKNILKRTFGQVLPDKIINRPKQPYRAPIYQCFIGEDAPEILRWMLSEEEIKAAGIFNFEKVNSLISKAMKGRMSEKDEMAFVNIVSTQLLNLHFIKNKGEQESITPKMIKIHE